MLVLCGHLYGIKICTFEDDISFFDVMEVGYMLSEIDGILYAMLIINILL